jgi:hypothetical protein
MPANFDPGWYDEYLYEYTEGCTLWDCSGCNDTFCVQDGNEPETDCSEGLLCTNCNERWNEDDRFDEEDAPKIGFSLNAMLHGGRLYGGE